MKRSGDSRLRPLCLSRLRDPVLCCLLFAVPFYFLVHVSSVVLACFEYFSVVSLPLFVAGCVLADPVSIWRQYAGCLADFAE